MHYRIYIRAYIMQKLEQLELAARLMHAMGASYHAAEKALLKKKPAAQRGQRSHWEKLTNDLCNAGLEDAADKRTLTARQMKDMAARPKHAKKAAAKFEKAQHLTGKASRALSNSWDKRTSTNVVGFFDHKKARAIKRGAA